MSVSTSGLYGYFTVPPVPAVSVLQDTRAIVLACDTAKGKFNSLVDLFASQGGWEGAMEREIYGRDFQTLFSNIVRLVYLIINLKFV